VENSSDFVRSFPIFQKHEPDPEVIARGCLSFEGFARYMMDKENSVYNEEDSTIQEADMTYPLSCYYIASSHNTYLTGPQLKGESSIDLYGQVKYIVRAVDAGGFS